MLKNQPAKGKETVGSFALGACTRQALRKNAEEMLAEGQVSQHAERSSLQLVTMTVSQPYECTQFAVTQQLLEKFTSCVLNCSFKNGQLIF